MLLNDTVVATSRHRSSTIKIRTKNHVIYCLVALLFASILVLAGDAQRVQRKSLFPLRGAVFLPHEKRGHHGEQEG